MYRARHFFIVTAVVTTSVALMVFDIKHEPFRPVASVGNTIAVSDLKSAPAAIRPAPVTTDPEVRVTTRIATASVTSSSSSEVSIAIATEPTLRTVATLISRSGADAGIKLIPLPVHKSFREKSDQFDTFDGGAELALVKSGLKARNATIDADAEILLSERARDVAPHREASLNSADSIGATKQEDAKQDDASAPDQTQVLQFDRDPFSTFGQ
jgi:hypothetical protein